jgi:hypothetical protein
MMAMDEIINFNNSFMNQNTNNPTNKKPCECGALQIFKKNWYQR